MVQRIGLTLCLLVPLLVVASCYWDTPQSGDTFRISADPIIDAITFEKINDISLFYQTSVSNYSALQYYCWFEGPGELNYSISPLSLGISIGNTVLNFSENSVICNICNMTTTRVGLGYTVEYAQILSFQVKFLQAASNNPICVGFYQLGNWIVDTKAYVLCLMNNLSLVSQAHNYSSCGICSCACNQCFGPRSGQCYNCSAGHYLQPFPAATDCSTSCPVGYYPNNTTNICTPCPVAGCSNCSVGNGSQCVTCLNGYYMRTIINTTNIINSTTGMNETMTVTYNICTACPVGCAVCSGGGSGQCSSCYSGYYGDGDGNCYACAMGTASCSGSSWSQASTCFPGYFLSSLGNGCSACSSACLSCYGTDYDTCETCAAGYFISQGICYSCPHGCSTCYNSQCSTCFPQYYLSGGAFCKICATGCLTCTGSNKTQCSQCISGYYFQPLNSTLNCSTTCPNGYYGENSINNCSTCAIGCATCTGPNNTQYPNCSVGYYLSNATTCSGCTSNCLSCSSNTTCDTCNTSYHLMPGNVSCVSQCPSGYCIYLNDSCVDCLAFCGDGKKLSYEGCDDGNLINGDGCSSICIVEENWVCQGGSLISPDTCGCSKASNVFQFGNSCVTLPPSTLQSVVTSSIYAVTTSGTAEGSLIGAQLISGASGSMFAAALNSLHVLMLFKYCDVGFPPNVEEFFNYLSGNSSSSSSTDSSTGIFNSFKILENKYSAGGQTPHQFNKYGVRAFFLSNVGSFFPTIAIVLFLIFVFNVLKILTKNSRINRIISDSVLPIIQWNMALSTIIGAQTKLALAWFLQFSNPFGNVYSIINFVIAILSLIAIIAVYVLIVFKITWNWDIVREQHFLSRQTITKAEIKQKTLGILWKSYDIYASIGRYFLIMQMSKNTLLITIIFALSNYPLAQCYSLLFLSVIYLIIMAIGRPFNRTLDAINAVCNEIGLLFQEILMTVFAVNVTKNFITLSVGNTLGWVMIGGMFLSLGLNIICIIFAVINNIVMGIKNRKKKQPIKIGKKSLPPRSKSVAKHVAEITMKQAGSPKKIRNNEKSSLNLGELEAEGSAFEEQERSFSVMMKKRERGSSPPKEGEKIGRFKMKGTVTIDEYKKRRKTFDPSTTKGETPINPREEEKAERNRSRKRAKSEVKKRTHSDGTTKRKKRTASKEDLKRIHLKGAENRYS